jgi:hypothetical protein
MNEALRQGFLTALSAVPDQKNAKDYGRKQLP